MTDEDVDLHCKVPGSTSYLSIGACPTSKGQLCLCFCLRVSRFGISELSMIVLLR